MYSTCSPQTEKKPKGQFFNWRPHFRLTSHHSVGQNTNTFLAYIVVKLDTEEFRSHPKPW